MSLTRDYAIQKREKRGDDLVVDMAFASDLPYERWWGVEILDIAGARLGRLNDGAPLLYNHNWNDLRGVHVPGSTRADEDGVLRGQVRITAATQAGRDTIALVDSGVLTKASVGYEIHKVIEITTTKSGEEVRREFDGGDFRALVGELETRAGQRVAGDVLAFRRKLDQLAGSTVGDRAEDTTPIYRVVDWEPYENSLVTVPADPSVGIGRGADENKPKPVRVTRAATESLPAAPAASPRSIAMSDQATAAGDTPIAAQSTVAPVQGTPGNRAFEMEQERRRGIENLCRANGIDDNIRDHWIGTGQSFTSISEELLRILEERGKSTKKTPATQLDLGAGEVRNYSLMKAIRACVDKNWTQAGFELECSQEISKRLNRVVDPNRFYVPLDVQQREVAYQRGASFTTPAARRAMGVHQRDLTAASASGGGYLVGTENTSFIELLRNRAVAYRMGARRLSGLSGNVTVPRQTAGATAYWLSSESTQITESQQTFGQMSLTPKTVGAYTEISRQLLLQSSPDAEGIVTSDLASVTAVAYDLGVLSGSGSAGQPTGIVNTAGIGSVTGTSLAFEDILEFQTDVAAGNVFPAAGGYVTTHAVASLCIQRVKYTNTASPLWEGNVWDGTMVGFPAMASNQMSSATMLFGDWSQVVVGEWGVLEVEVNPFANFQAGIIGVRAISSMDCGLRYAAAFSYASSIT